MFTEASYHNFQKQLSADKAVRYFWQFWGNYSFIFFGIAIIAILSSEQLKANSRPAFILSILAFLIARGFIVTVISLAHERKRPYQVFGFKPIVTRFFSLPTKRPNSFPSGHAAAFFSVATVICLFYPLIGALLVAVSLLMCAARIVLGFHWPSDIVVSIIIGTLVGYLTVLVGYSVLFT